MIPFDIMLTFVGSAILLSLIPGPDNIFVLTQSAVSGRRSGVFITLGLCTGLMVHTAAVAFGVAAIFALSPIAFVILKSVGTLYLLYLAWQAFRATSSNPLNDQEIPQAKFAHLYRRGIIMNLTNPKVVIFFMAFLPQFTYPDNGAIWLQLSILGGLFILSALLVFSAIAILAGYLRQYLLKTPSFQTIANKVAGVVFIALAVRLFMVEK